MDFLQSFSLRDLLIFSPESYFKLFELSNKALWPLHIPFGLLAIIAIVVLYKRQHFATQFYLAWLGLVWGFVGYSYFGVFYSQISTYAHYVNYFFWAEALLLFLYAFVANHESIYSIKTPLGKWRIISGYSLIVYGVFIHPMVSLFIWNQSIIRLELFSIAPDPTAIATIGFTLLLPARGYLILVVIPSLWLLLSIMTYQAF